MMRLQVFGRNVAAVPLFIAAALVLTSPGFADWRDDIGWTQLKAERGATLKNGAGVDVLHVEVEEPTSYMLYAAHPQFAGKTFNDLTGTGNPLNTATGHSESVGFMFYGLTTSIAPGITNISVYEANDFVNNTIGFSGGTDPVALPFQVQNHSYVFSGLTEAQALAVLDRMDFIANQQNATIVVGAANASVANPNPSTPQAYAHGYNSITVGRTDGMHSHTLTTFNGVGRAKPEIVVSGSTVLGDSQTSWSTGMVSSAAAVLRQGETGNGVQNEVIKAQLLAGATKTEFPAWDRTDTRPLDDVFGAGELNIRNSYLIQEGGEFEGFLAADAGTATSAALFGWDYDSTFDPVNDLHYNFEIASGQMVDELSAILTWNQEVIDTDNTANFAPITSLANMDLELFDSSGSFLGNMLQQSISTGNVEHIYLTGLSAGTYTLRVSSDLATDYGLAWRITTVAVPEPGAATIGMLAAAFCLFRRRR